MSVLEEPIAASSIVPMYFVCERARQDVKVALVGQGPGRAVRRLHSPPRRPLRGAMAAHSGLAARRVWKRASSSLPRNETLKRGVYSLDVDDRMRALPATCFR